MNIAITGEGIVSAIGNDKASVLQSLIDGKTGIGEIHYLSSLHNELPVGEVKLSNAEMKAKLGIPTDNAISRTTLLGMLAVRQAVDEACISEAGNERVLLISGTTVGGMDITEQWYGTFADSDEHLACIKSHECGCSTEDIAAAFGIFTDSTTISTACSSAANAIILGARLLECGQADVVVAGGSEALSRFHLNGFNSLMILDHEQCRPFDATRAGLNLGEGAAFIVMETAEHAAKRNAAIHAYLTGYGNACDAYHQTASSENGDGAYLAMREAIEMSSLQPGDIDYVNAHGTGTPNNDLSESAALKRIFGETMPPVSSTKSFTGHTTSASGSIETVICLLAMLHHFIPTNLGWKHQMADGITPTMGEQGRDMRNVLCNSFGFGGNDSSLILSTVPKDSKVPKNPKTPQAITLSRFEISTIEQLADIRQYMKPLEARRMGKIMKSSYLSSVKALEDAGIETPDAIITATARGCLENGEHLLQQLEEEGEVMLKPTWFMQSTHNTIGSDIAIRTGCHGYNITYSHGEKSLEWALRDAEMLITSGKATTVLVGLHDESTPLFNSFMERLGKKPLPLVHSVAIVLGVKK